MPETRLTARGERALAEHKGGTVARSHTPAQLALLKRTLGGGKLKNDEFDLYIETAKHLELDPFKRQIVPIIFNQNDENKRRVEFVVTQQGYRSRALKSGTWGPWIDEDALRAGKEPAPNPQVFFRKELVDPDTNPLGIDYAVYYCKKYRSPASDAYDIVMGKARWVERVPLKEIWSRDEKSGRDRPTGRFRINSPQWNPVGGQPVHMIGKCAEADALRRGWPDETSGIYLAEELERAVAVEESASKMAEMAEIDRRQSLVGKGIPMIWAPGDPIVREEEGALADKIMAWLREAKHPLEVQKFEERNTVGLQDLWSASKNDGLAVREAIDKRIKALSVIDVEDESTEGSPDVEKPGD